ncbi:hypothetical protein CYMTET_6417 [Cymbomonas tetramitiformis]|uniref:Pentacotripeptide-repeat region of PRORP domain-containing protein n=1 Tax=Cymbomonas tetramitiformis TaxID=36881 RepID=A0AAE0GXF8_9CHLO|nr:hypothetical protein CYMTET_6417 [Cymbomonas tetramitiformis]
MVGLMKAPPALTTTLVAKGKGEVVELMLNETVLFSPEPETETSPGAVLTKEEASKASTRLLHGLLKDGDTAAAWRHFNDRLRDGTVDVFHCNVMLKACDSSEEQKKLIERMRQHDIPPNVVTYNTLIHTLLNEVKLSEVRQVCREMQAADIDPDDITRRALQTSAVDLSKKDSQLLSRLLKAGKKAKAWEHFEVLLQTDCVDVYHCNVMTAACDDSGAVRRHMDRMSARDVAPDVTTYNALIAALVREGDHLEAGRVLEGMRSAGMKPNKQTRKMMQQPPIWPSKETEVRPLQPLKDAALVVTSGGGDPVERVTPGDGNPAQGGTRGGGESSVGKQFEQPVAKKADAARSIDVAPTRDRSSAAVQCFIDGMRKKAKAPSTSMYAVLMQVLVTAGNQSEAEMLLEEMLEAKIVADVKIQRILDLPADWISKHNTEVLNRLVRGGEYATAWKGFKQLLELRMADLYQFNVMMKACDSSKAQRALVQQIREFGLEPDSTTYNTMMRRLVLEGKLLKARQLMEKMKDTGLEASLHTHRTLNMPVEEISKHNTAILIEHWQHGRVEQAWLHFNQLMETGTADLFHLKVMTKMCATSAERQWLMKRMDAQGIAADME